MHYNEKIKNIQNNLEQVSTPLNQSGTFNHQVSVITPETAGRFDVYVKTSIDGDWEKVSGNINLSNERSMVFNAYVYQVKISPRATIAQNYDVVFQGGSV